MAQLHEGMPQDDAVKTETDQRVDHPQTTETEAETEAVRTISQANPYGFTNPPPLIRYYISGLPIICFALRLDWIKAGVRKTGPYLYCGVTIVLLFLLVRWVCNQTCHVHCDPSKAFFWKVVAAISGPAIVAGGVVIAPLFFHDPSPDVYAGYLLGRLSFLIAVSMLLCIGNTKESLPQQYQEGLYQLGMTWSAFALLFIADPIITNYVFSIRATTLTANKIVLALVFLNFCGGITLIGLPLWKLNELRKLMKEEESRSQSESSQTE